MTTDRDIEMAKAIDDAEAGDDDAQDDGYARPKRPRRSAGDVYTFRLPAERREQLRAAAELRGVPPATLIREWTEARLDGDLRRAGATRTIEDMSKRLLEASLITDVVGSRSFLVHPARPGQAEVVPSFDVARFHQALSDLIDSAGVVSGFAAVTEGLHRTLSAALVELDVVKEHLVEAASAMQPRSTDVRRSTYDPLRVYLLERDEPVVTLTFSQVERILGRRLPASARRYRPWWANESEGTHTHARAWLDANRRTRNVDLNAGTIEFVR
jgi:predicted DNA-binding protein